MRIAANGVEGFADIINNSNWQHGSDVVLDTDGGLLIAGSTRGTVFFGAQQSAPIGQEDLFVAKLDTSGNYGWYQRYGGNSTSYVNNPSIAVRPFNPNAVPPFAGDIVVTGSIVGELTFSTAGAGIQAVSNGGNDVFVGKLLSGQ